jgi:hypothetical protein
MKNTNCALIGLILLTTCAEQSERQQAPAVESGKAALGVVPTSEVAEWKKFMSAVVPPERYLQAATLDENRKVVIVFGGANLDKTAAAVVPNQETWEWSTVTGKWTNRTGSGSKPAARSGAAIVYDSDRGKVVLFGGRAANGTDLDDTWEWEPSTGVWTPVSLPGNHPSARNQHGMVYQKSTKTILLFGGGNSDPQSIDATEMTASLGDTWEYDPAIPSWTKRSPSSTPSIRHDFGLVWDSSRNKTVLFGGLQTDIAGLLGIPKQDIWDWDPAASTWTERTAQDTKPSARFAHAMAFEGVRQKVVVFGGMDINTGKGMNDLWEWDPKTGKWQKRLTGNETGVPSNRIFASMVAVDAKMALVAGAIDSNWTTGKEKGNELFFDLAGIREVWELDPATPAFTDRTPADDSPSARQNPAMAYNPSTGKTYLFGGQSQGDFLDDLLFWDGSGNGWTPIVTDVRPSPRYYAAMAYDPIRKSLILYGGFWSGLVGSGDNIRWERNILDDTWELSGDGKWTELHPASKPEPLQAHTMVTDTARNKVLIYGGARSDNPTPGVPDTGFYKNRVWEWDGGTMTWTDRSPPAATDYPTTVWSPAMTYDDVRQKLFVYELAGNAGANSWFWEWDAVSAGWSKRDAGDSPGNANAQQVVYDSIRKREILYTNATDSTGKQETWELDNQGPTWFVRSFADAPAGRIEPRMVFDSKRGVAILYGGTVMASNETVNDTWEYKVTNLGNGEGCNTGSPSSCASGFCVDGVCCDVAACTGACKSCSVPGSLGTCTMVKAGTEVPGSCSAGQACDGSGSCLAKNGQPCTSDSTCASGMCADGVCCDGACTGSCVACNQAGQEGKCRPYPAGTDPQNECSGGTGACKATCDGVGNCAFPQKYTICAPCTTCDGKGTCSEFDSVCGAGGAGGYGGGTEKPYITGGSGGSVTGVGGAAGATFVKGGAGGAGGISNTGGVGGAGGSSKTGGAGGSPGGAGGSNGGSSGATAVGGSGGATSLGGGTGSGGSGVVPGSGGAGGGASDASAGNRDGGFGDGSAAPHVKRGGCSCTVGAAPTTTASPTLLLFVVGAFLATRYKAWRSKTRFSRVRKT